MTDSKAARIWQRTRIGLSIVAIVAALLWFAKGAHGVAFTRVQIVLYTLALFAVSLLPFVTSMSGPIYLGGAVFLGIGFLAHALRLHFNPKHSALPMKTFGFSIYYLAALFALLLVDHYLPHSVVA